MAVCDVWAVFFFFFKQKTAYEIYQCDWSSDVCSSDLTSDRTLFLFKKEFQAGTVVLGGNESVPSMYAVYVGTAGVSTGGSPSAGCVSCANGVNLSLSWNANADEITGYRVYMGNSNTTVNTEIKDIPKISASFDAANPNITFDAGVDLKLNHGDTACFAIKAYSNYGLSPASDAVCKTL